MPIGNRWFRSLSLKKICSLFKLKDRNQHAAQVVYIGTRSCNNIYIGETSRNLHSRIDEHLDTSKLSETARHLYSHQDHFLTWKAIVSVQSWTLRGIVEALLIAKLRPNLNKQMKSFTLSLFPMGIT